MLRLLRTDLGRARLLLYAVILAAGVCVGWLGKQSYAVHKLTRGVGDTWFHSADGRPWFRLDEQRHDVPMAAISPHLQHAFVAVEDHRFFRHPGVDPIALARAIVRNVRAPGTVEGGSTITQQLARTLFLSNRRATCARPARRCCRCSSKRSSRKPQILELYLNRIYLSAGVYGVEAMSAARLRQAGQGADDCRERAHRRPGPGAGHAVAVVEPRRRRRPQPRGAGADARRRVHHRRRRSSDARRAQFRVRPYQRQRRRTARLRQGLPAPALPRRVRRRPSARLARGHHLQSWRCRTRRKPRWRVGSAAWASRRCRRRSWRSIRRPATCWRWSAGATISGRRSTAPAAAGASRARPSSRSCSPRRSSAGCRRCRSCSGLDRIAPQGPDEWTPRNVHDDAPDGAHAARGAARVGQPRGHLAAAAGGIGARAARGRRTRASTTCPTCRRWRSAPASSRRWP